MSNQETDKLHILRVEESKTYLEEQNKIEITKYEKNMQEKIILGDSQLYDIELEGFTNCCIKGDNILNATYRLERYLKQISIKEIIICLATNDIDQLYSLEEIVANYKKLLSLLDENIKVTLLPIFNINDSFDNEYMRSRTNHFINQLNYKLVEELDYNILPINNLFNTYGQLNINLTTDGLHLNEKALTVVKDILSKQQSRSASNDI